eukprot:TRINITY_DN11273_c0_g2_i1.p1 TRINITY_DN11273_c0_g2~~TRINITY_DN11273_c0_g2_i1.p1  ORF type:complete len:931 (+),score=210.74 TRINITY_DN11273_c0_g2_i1:155-2947(+)
MASSPTFSDSDDANKDGSADVDVDVLVDELPPLPETKQPEGASSSSSLAPLPEDDNASDASFGRVASSGSGMARRYSEAPTSSSKRDAALMMKTIARAGTDLSASNRMKRTSVVGGSKFKPMAPTDIFDDESKIGPMLKGLINTSVIENGWSKVRKQLAAIEKDLGEVDKRVDDDFVKRKDFKQLLQQSMTEPDGEGDNQLKRMSALTDSLHGQMTRAGPKLEVLSKEVEALNEKIETCAQDCKTQIGKAEENANRALKAESMRVFLGLDKHGARLDDLFQCLEDLKKSQAEAAQALEERIKKVAREEAQRVCHELIFSAGGEAQLEPPRVRNSEEIQSVDPKAQPARVRQRRPIKVVSPGSVAAPEQWRQGLLNFLEASLLDPLRKEKDEMAKDLGSAHSEFDRKLRSTDKNQFDMQAKVAKTVKDVEMEVNQRRTEQAKLEARAQDAASTAKDIFKLIDEKAKEAIDRHVQLTDTVALLSKKQADHTREFFNCSTKKDEQEIHNKIKQCNKIEVYKKDQSEVQKQLDSMMDKISNLGMEMSASAKMAQLGGSGKNRKKTQKIAKNASSQNLASTDTMMTTSTRANLGSVDSLLEDSNTSPCDVGGTPASPIAVGAPEDQEGFEDIAEEESCSKPRQLNQGSEGGAGKVEHPAPPEEDFDDDPDDAEEEEEPWDVDSDAQVSSSPAEIQMREQVEAMSMGLVCLAFQVFKGSPQLGLSRQTRLLNEKELLDELLALRHWVTQKSKPQGWGTGKLVTMALRHAHPTSFEVHGPQPQIQWSKEMMSKTAPPGEGFGSFNKALDQAPSFSDQAYPAARVLEQGSHPGSKESVHQAQEESLSVAPQQRGMSAPCGETPGVTALPIMTIMSSSSEKFNPQKLCRNKPVMMPLSARGPGAKKVLPKATGGQKGPELTLSSFSLVSPRLPPVSGKA